LEAIRNALEKYSDKSDPKEGMFSYVGICVEVDLEKGIHDYHSRQLERSPET
jgi:hypothetical protein